MWNIWAIAADRAARYFWRSGCRLWNKMQSVHAENSTQFAAHRSS